MTDDKEEEGWILISLVLCGEADEQVVKRLKELVKVDPVLKNQVSILESCWKHRRIADEDAFNKFYIKLLKRLPAK